MGSPHSLTLSRRTFRILLLAGFLARLACLPLAGIEDMQVWKHWSYAASDRVASMYGVGGTPPERGLVRWGTRQTTVTYPPAALYALAVVGHVYRAFDPTFTDAVALTAVIKLSIAAGDLLIALAIGVLLLRRAGPDGMRAGVVMFWLNPAVLLNGAILGYLDSWSAAPACAAFLAADAGLPVVAGAALTVGAMVKPQALFVAPAVALILWHTRRRRLPAIVGLCASAALAGLILVMPFARIGALPNLRLAVGSLLRHDMLSGTAANLWWIVTWLLRASYAVRDLGAWHAWTMKVGIIGISRVIELGYINPRPIAAAMVLVAVTWALWRADRAAQVTPAVPIFLAATAFAIHAYFVLGIQVHENHLYLALPVLAIVAGADPRFRSVLGVVSAIAALNLFLFYGIGRGFPLPPRGFTVIDATVVLSFANVVSLAWHATVLQQATNPATVDRNRDARHV